MSRRWDCSTRWKTARCWKRSSVFRAAACNILSPWAVKRLEEFGGDIRQFRVVKRYPSILKQIGIAKTEPGTKTTRTSPAW